MLDYFIPNAYAQVTRQVKSAAAAGKDVAVEGGKAGLQEFVNYIANNIGNWIAGVVIVVISYIVAKMAAGAVKEAIIKKKGEDIHESQLVLIERITTITVLTVGITIALAINGLNFTAVIGALSLGIGFAMKDIIGNFISGIIMLAQNRVNIGDFIKVGDILGTIVSIDVRATILQAIDGTEVVIPNQMMLSQTLVSYSSNPFRRIELIVGVDYGTDLPMVTSLVRGIIDNDPDIVVKPEPLVLIDEFSDSSINIKILFWIESGNNWMKVRSNLANRIKKAFNEIGVNIPFPIRTLKLDQDDRAFLKTMDSMKKGVIPEPKATPDKEQVKQTALGTARTPQVPEPLFTAPTPAPQPAGAVESEDDHPRPTAGAQTEPEKIPVAVMEKPEEAEKPIPPPTHL